MKFIFLLLFLSINCGIFFCLGDHRAQAASCCASGTALPGLITGDHEISMNASYSYGTVIGEIRPGFDKLYLWPRDRKLISQTLSLSGSMQLSDYQQISLNLPVLSKRYEMGNTFNEDSTNLGDVSMAYAYEFLPETEFSYWKPRGFLSTRLILPTGRSQFASNQASLSDVTGIGQWGVGVGTALFKVINRWDFSVFPELRTYFGRNFSKGSTDLDAASFVGAVMSLGGGYYFSETKLRLGLQFMPQWVGVRKTSYLGQTSKTAEEIYCESSVQLSYLIDELLSLHLTYFDQTVIGPVANTNLSRGLAFRLQKFWQ